MAPQKKKDSATGKSARRKIAFDEMPEDNSNAKRKKTGKETKSP